MSNFYQGEDLIEFDKNHLWHPYTSMANPLPAYSVVRTKGVKVWLQDGTELIDGMSSWWAAIHGYCHPQIVDAMQKQLETMPHFMFGGVTHDPAVGLAQRLIKFTDNNFPCIFYADSGSVSIEVALKMALQYWQAVKKVDKNSILTIRGGYHGDTFKAMSICDPVNGMHFLFEKVFQKRYFADAPTSKFGEEFDEQDLVSITELVKNHHEELAVIILEPIVQGAGGMKFYHQDYLNAVRQLCDEYNILLIFDEIATGFGRTGKLFAYQHTQIIPDILCVGKALTGGSLTMAAVMTTRKVAEQISSDGGVLMHGPTFMGNPLACAAACASLDILATTPWQEQVARLEEQMRRELEPAKLSPKVADVRVLGAIGVIEMKESISQAELQAFFVQECVWLRPFGKLIYIMPSYIMKAEELTKITNAMIKAVL